MSSKERQSSAWAYIYFIKLLNWAFSYFCLDHCMLIMRKFNTCMKAQTLKTRCSGVSLKLRNSAWNFCSGPSLLTTKGPGGQYPSGIAFAEAGTEQLGHCCHSCTTLTWLPFSSQKKKILPEECMVKDTNQNLQKIFLACLPPAREHWLLLEYLFQTAPIFQPSTHLMINKAILSSMCFMKKSKPLHICNSLKAASRAVKFYMHIQRNKDYVQTTVINKGQEGRNI